MQPINTNGHKNWSINVHQMSLGSKWLQCMGEWIDPWLVVVRLWYNCRFSRWCRSTLEISKEGFVYCVCWLNFVWVATLRHVGQHIISVLFVHCQLSLYLDAFLSHIMNSTPWITESQLHAGQLMLASSKTVSTASEIRTSPRHAMILRSAAGVGFVFIPLDNSPTCR